MNPFCIPCSVHSMPRFIWWQQTDSISSNPWECGNFESRIHNIEKLKCTRDLVWWGAIHVISCYSLWRTIIILYYICWCNTEGLCHSRISKGECIGNRGSHVGEWIYWMKTRKWNKVIEHWTCVGILHSQSNFWSTHEMEFGRWIQNSFLDESEYRFRQWGVHTYYLQTQLFSHKQKKIWFFKMDLNDIFNVSMDIVNIDVIRWYYFDQKRPI